VTNSLAYCDKEFTTAAKTGPGVNVTKLFMAVIYQFTSLMFVGKLRRLAEWSTE
jgi:hypothetical protein